MLSLINQALTKKFIPNNYYTVYRMKKKSQQKLIAAYKLNSHLCVFVFFFLLKYSSFIFEHAIPIELFNFLNQINWFSSFIQPWLSATYWINYTYFVLSVSSFFIFFYWNWVWFIFVWTNSFYFVEKLCVRHGFGYICTI